MFMENVVIVGAGPTGLMMAAELARYGVKCRIIDKMAKPSDKSRAIAIQARTLEIFAQIGIIDRFLAEGVKLHAANPTSQGMPLGRLNFSELDSPFPFVLSVEQTKTEEILSDHLKSYGIEVEREVELTHFHQHDNVIDLTWLNQGQKEEIQTEWLIGCDGAHSIVRKGVDLTFEGKALPDVFSLADVHVHWDKPHDELFAFLDGSGIMAAFPLPQKDHYRLVFQLERCKHQQDLEQIAPPTLEEAEALLQKLSHSKVKLSNPIWLTHFKINSRITNHYQKDHIFLAGDAAHIHSPVGGQGMNTGIQDSYNLAWKLAYVTQHSSPKSLLDSYHQERHAVGKKLLKGTELGTSIALFNHPILVFLRNKLAHWLIPMAHSQIVQTLSQTGIQYPFDPHDSIGHLGSKYPIGKRAIRFLKPECTGFQVLYADPDDLSLPYSEEHCQLVKLDRDGMQEYGIRQSGAYVVRPDGYISFRCAPLDREKIKHHLDQVLFHTNSHDCLQYVGK